MGAKINGLAVVAGLTTFVAADVVRAQQGVRMPCDKSQEVARQLSSRYDEAPIAFGLQSNGNLLQVYASEDGGTWTIVSTSPTGISCIVGAGKRWETKPRPVKEPLA